ncbi:hypothetical protein ILUMI_05068 [Ignelater luminosus]|uniref:Protein sleepless n=1 Tax=Ignelater luminosus TaxID=2038154 RepID=A0A8K0DDL8_IGNLU|nr:hypothetical protein ILUMI_05068 [Ignelater luminosus]
MNFYSQLFCFAVVLMTLVKTGESLKCYQCQSAANGTCNNPLNTSKVTVRQCPRLLSFCGLLNVTVNGNTNITRECVSSNFCYQILRQRRQVITSTANSFSRSCNICNSNLCNSSSSFTSFLGLIFIGLLLGKYYCNY